MKNDKQDEQRVEVPKSQIQKQIEGIVSDNRTFEPIRNFFPEHMYDNELGLQFYLGAMETRDKTRDFAESVEFAYILSKIVSEFDRQDRSLDSISNVDEFNQAFDEMYARSREDLERLYQNPSFKQTKAEFDQVNYSIEIKIDA